MKSLKLGCLALLIGIVCLYLANAYAAENGNDPYLTRMNKLLEASRLECHLGKGAMGVWDEGEVKNMEMTTFQEQFSFSRLVFESIDRKNGTARVIVNEKPSNVSMIRTGGGISFIQKGFMGGLEITTVFFECKKGTDSYLVVHSLHHPPIEGFKKPSSASSSASNRRPV